MRKIGDLLTDEHLLVKEFLEKVDKHCKYVRYDFQELGLMLASRLGEWPRRSFYIKLAKEEDKKLLMQAFMYAADASESKRARLFLWKLEQLKQRTSYRAFTAIFFSPEKNPSINALYTFARRLKGAKPTDPLHYHITLAFWQRLPGIYYPYVVRMVSKLRRKYGEEIEVVFKAIEQVKSRYVWLLETNDIPYRIFHSQKKLISTKVKAEVFPTSQRKFLPHLTIARIKNQTEYKKNHVSLNSMVKLPVTLKGEIVFVISTLTPDGPRYRPHKWY